MITTIAAIVTWGGFLGTSIGAADSQCNADTMIAGLRRSSENGWKTPVESSLQNLQTDLETAKLAIGSKATYVE